MQLHPNAKLTPSSRTLLVERVNELGWPVARAAQAAGVSRQTAYKWLNRFKEAGESGLQDRSCRPHRIPFRTPRKLIRRMEQLRRRRKAAWEISQQLGVPVSTVSKHLKEGGLGRISRTAFSAVSFFSMVPSPFGARNPLLYHRSDLSNLG